MEEDSLMTKVSRYFDLSEVTKSYTAIRKGIDNSLPKELLDNVKLVATEVMDKIRYKYGAISPTSWYRCEELNTSIGSSYKSQHCKGEAVDFEIIGIDNYEVACWIADNLEFDQLILEYYNEQDINSGWIHVSYTKDGNRNQTLRFDGKKYYKGLEDD